ncbi:MAG: hypothetical protein ABIG64_04500 [Candidatus Omnitrophota bacterium]
MNSCPLFSMLQGYLPSSFCKVGSIVVLLIIGGIVGYVIGHKGEISRKSQKKTGFLAFFNKKVKKMGFIDMKCSQISAMIFGIIVAKLVPYIFDVRIRWLLLVMVIFSLKPLYVIWIKKDA